jgi:hypothetical protein
MFRQHTGWPQLRFGKALERYKIDVLAPIAVSAVTKTGPKRHPHVTRRPPSSSKLPT